MEFLGIPEEVIEGSLLPYLRWNDLLRFRRVCRTTKDITDGYLKLHPELAPEIEINEEDKSFHKFLEMGIPTSKIFLNNVSGIEFYLSASKDESASEFLKRFGPAVKHLRVDQMSVNLFVKELEFLEGFVNLQSFKAGKNEGYRKDFVDSGMDADNGENPGKFIFPNVFKQLKSVSIGNNEPTVFNQLVKFGSSLLAVSKEVQVIALPFISTRGVLPTVSDQMESLEAVLMLEEYIRERGRENGTTNLKELVFANYHYQREKDAIREIPIGVVLSTFFLQLCATCLKWEVKLRNVDPSWFLVRIQREVGEVPELCSPELGIVVLSLISLHPCVFPLDMPNLEIIKISTTSWSSPGVNWRQGRPYWPSLKTLEINVDSMNRRLLELMDSGHGIGITHMTSTNSLFKFFFEDVSREALTELHFKFMTDAGSVAVPKVEDIVSSCPNLRRLTLSNWPGTNKAMTKLWSGLQGLDEISLEHCKDLGNVAFVGEDARSPVFLKLERLRKLSLKGLDEMPKLTDTLFSLVIRHLKLTHLTLTAKDPIKSVTLGGIRSLLTERFGGSIQKFSFEGWSLASASTEEFKRLEQDFRSHYMI